MERESFMSPEVADLLNKHFVPIIVDREERPDLSVVYMNYIEAMLGTGGWPMNLFLTPELQPVFGGTYFASPSSTAGTPSESNPVVNFPKVLERLQSMWSTQEKRIRDDALEQTKKLQHRAEEGVHNPGEPAELDLELLDEACRTIKHGFDGAHGGFGHGLKFPLAPKLQFLLHLGEWPNPVKDLVGRSGMDAATMATMTLRKIARSSIRDHVGYGIHRCSIPADWSLPHFEKMLSDQAQLLDRYLDAFTHTHDHEFRAMINDLATYITSDPIQRDGGGFYSSEDSDSAPSKADTEKREGAYYVWTLKELVTVLGPQQGDLAARFYGVKADGNIAQEYDPHDDFVQQNTLGLELLPAQLSAELGLPEDDVIAQLKDARIKLRQHREKERPRPRLDDKIIAEWNGLAIGALARASAAMTSWDEERSTVWLRAAIDAAKFVRAEMWEEKGGQLWRIWRDGHGTTRGLAEDYASMIYGALELYTATFDLQWLQWADEMQKAQLTFFWAPMGAFYSSPAPATDLLVRIKPGMDTTEPSANALSAANLIRLSSLLDDKEYERYARKTVAAFETEIDQFPGSFPGLLQALAWLGVGNRTIRLEGPDVTARGSDLSLSATLAKLRRQPPVARTLLRITGGVEEAWLRQRRAPVFKVTAVEKRRHRELRSLREV